MRECKESRCIANMFRGCCRLCQLRHRWQVSHPPTHPIRPAITTLRRNQHSRRSHIPAGSPLRHPCLLNRGSRYRGAGRRLPRSRPITIRAIRRCRILMGRCRIIVGRVSHRRTRRVIRLRAMAGIQATRIRIIPIRPIRTIRRAGIRRSLDLGVIRISLSPRSSRL